MIFFLVNNEKIIKYLYDKGIEVKVRHPILINNQPIFKNLKKTKLKMQNIMLIEFFHYQCIII